MIDITADLDIWFSCLGYFDGEILEEYIPRIKGSGRYLVIYGESSDDAEFRRMEFGEFTEDETIRFFFSCSKSGEVFVEVYDLYEDRPRAVRLTLG
jgi:hypothetical protein